MVDQYGNPIQPPTQPQPVYVDQYGNPIQQQPAPQYVDQYGNPIQQQPVQVVSQPQPQLVQDQPIQPTDTTGQTDPAPTNGEGNYGTSEFGERLKYEGPVYQDKVWAIIWIVHLVIMIIALC